MKSMTGYGKYTATQNEREMTIEMKSVNNRYLEVNVRIPKTLSAVEEVIRRVVKSQLSRGTVDVFVNYVNSSASSKKIVIDETLLGQYVETSKRISKSFAIKNSFSTSDALKISDAIRIESGEDDIETITSLAEICATEACNAMNEMRKTEGCGIKDDLVKIMSSIENELQKVVETVPSVVKEYSEKLRERIKELLENVEIDEARFANEVAFFADKADINEEISRLLSHIAQFYVIINESEQVGRKLDFLSQEINREINTMGSKANNASITASVLFMKNELEKIKEQIRNIE